MSVVFLYVCFHSTQDQWEESVIVGGATLHLHMCTTCYQIHGSMLNVVIAASNKFVNCFIVVAT